ncbi:hypothetical protein HOU00_gp291 [Caulobacter phage CcrPW]|uniref:Uncharacterized protein n=1 Tax=Caulobacter phage CcrPW TaxID=2283271 RepID=A0A385EAF4_9CAUD|nr:hypothetical protein HOU00_gp291 [Caulobacter phage CcrPW]AXQ68834.1 hypothetical protein CcrPW_gp295 [Caulobacter phage CcrPW]
MEGRWVEGPIDEATTLRTRVEWLINLAHEPDSICYITG